MNIKRGAIAATIAGALLIPTLSATTAAATDTGRIWGREACEHEAQEYRAMGYNARCYNTHDEWFYVNYEKPRPGQAPSTGSAG